MDSRLRSNDDWMLVHVIPTKAEIHWIIVKYGLSVTFFRLICPGLSRTYGFQMLNFTRAEEGFRVNRTFFSLSRIQTYLPMRVRTQTGNAVKFNIWKYLLFVHIVKLILPSTFHLRCLCRDPRFRFRSFCHHLFNYLRSNLFEYLFLLCFL